MLSVAVAVYTIYLTARLNIASGRELVRDFSFRDALESTLEMADTGNCNRYMNTKPSRDPPDTTTVKSVTRQLWSTCCSPYHLAIIIVLILSYWLLSKRNSTHSGPAVCTKNDSTGAITRRVTVLVLGDVGRSPRMQNHAVSFAKADWQVDLVGFKGLYLGFHSL